MSTEVNDAPIAIKISGVSKSFKLQADRRSTLKERFVRGRSKHEDHFDALKDVSFTIRKGTTFGMIGHNGSGKSTLLKILAGIYLPTEGEVMVEDKVDALIELGAGFHGDLTGRENIYLNGAILGRSKAEIASSIDWIIDFADIGEFIDEPVKIYSSGMVVRLGFAVAVAIKPTILVVDEIIAVGDEDFQRKCFELMRNLKQQGTTIALVTHSLSLAQDMCDEIVWMDHGRARMIGPAADVISAYVSSVNKIEAEKRSADASAINLDYDPFRDNQGSGEARVTGVELLDDDGAPLQFLTTGKPATIRLHTRTVKPLQQVEVGLGFALDNGTSIAGPNSRAGGKLFDLEVGESYVDYHVDDVVFQPGQFWLDTALVHEGHIYDYAHHRMVITVRADSVPNEPGVIALPAGTWTKGGER